MARAWEALKRHDRATGQHLYTVLRCQVDYPEMRSAQMAEHLEPQVGKPLTAEWIYKRLYNARRKFTDLLLDEVAQSLESPLIEELEEELRELGLFQHCQDALQRRRET